jgi:hypothetical protein
VRVADESEVDIDVVDGRYPELVRLIKEYRESAAYSVPRPR